MNIFHLGILGGMAITGATVDTGVSPNTLSASAQASYKAGISAEYQVLPNLLSFEADALYASYQWEQTTVAITPSVDYSTNWLEIPMFINYTGISQFRFGLGPVVDVGLGNVSTVNSDGTGAQSESYAAAGFQRVSVAMAMQVGYQAQTAVKQLSVDADLRYLMGLNNFSTNPPMMTKLHSFDFLVGLGYAF